MKIVMIWSFAILILLSVVGMVPTFAAPPATTSQITRGKYLVEEVGKCEDCHTEHDEMGQAIPGKKLQGAILPFKMSPQPPVWADKSANIAGLPGWNREGAVRFLMTGLAYNNLPARPPMPLYKLNKEDAEAIVAYLKSLSPTDKGKH
jgi:mono/diheme cytochrome c family protein